MASSFMSPAESKSFTNVNRVRMFGKKCKYIVNARVHGERNRVVESTVCGVSASLARTCPSSPSPF